MPPQLTRVIRLDSLPLNQTYFTNEGYLIDRPIVTSTGIFEYANADGSIRRELRTPEEVFNSESLKSYKGKPVIITHDAGLINKDNVRKNQIGTILTDGYRNGDDVRAEIVIHDTDAMKNCHLKELSLGYNLDLDETPGEWNGQHYDAVQKNIRINHLALVREARAGDQARLNIDSRDQTTLKGGKRMSYTKNGTRADSVLSPDELETAIKEYKARRAKGDADKPNPFAQQTDPAAGAPAPEAAPAPTPEAKPNPFEKKDADNPFEKKEEPAAPAPVPGPVPGAPAPEAKPNPFEKEEDADDEPAGAPVEDPEAAFNDVKDRNGEVADEDYQLLCDIIDTLLAQRAYDCAVQKDSEDDPALPAPAAPVAPAPEEKKENPFTEDEEDEETEEEEEEEPAVPLATDSRSDSARTWLQIGMVARDLNLDGLENMSRVNAMKTVIKAVTPSLRLDGKSEVYITALFDRAVLDAKEGSRRDISYQYRQAFNRDGRAKFEDTTSARARRQAMIERNTNRNN